MKKLLLWLLWTFLLVSSANASFILTNTNEGDSVRVTVSTDTPINAKTVASQIGYDITSLNASELSNLTPLDTITLENNDAGLTLIAGGDEAKMINWPLFSFKLTRNEWVTDTDFIVQLIQGSYVDENDNENQVAPVKDYIVFNWQNASLNNTNTYSWEAKIQELEPIAVWETNVKTWKESFAILLLVLISVLSLFTIRKKA